MVSTSLPIITRLSSVISSLIRPPSTLYDTDLFIKTAIDSNYMFAYLEMQDRKSHRSKTGSHWLQVSKESVYGIGYNFPFEKYH